MNEPVTVTYDLVEILKELKQDIKDVNTKLDKQSERLNTIEVELVEIKTELKSVSKRLESVEGTQKNQVWALIVLLGGAIVTAGARLFFTTNP
jgi:septal ring factor EnvC (AmiA/AmiB activator)